jgi:hypothetical protein
MARQNGLASIVDELKAERTDLANQLRQLDAALSALGNLNPRSTTAAAGRSVSAAARRRMAAAQKARWAKARQGHSDGSGEDKTNKTPAKRTMSAAVRRRIAATQKARWAKLRTQQKKAA